MTPPTPGTLEPGQVRAMFDRISGFYDVMNSVMTAGLHHRWRARAVDLAGVGPGSRVLDVATGTGDLAIELASRVAPGGSTVACDFSEAMLDRARGKLVGAGAGAGAGAGRRGRRRSGTHRPEAGSDPRIVFEWGDAMAMDYPGDTFDAATVGFGARNFDDLERGLSEMARVVRPGGRVVILEITTPTRPPLSTFFRLWFDRLVPALGRLAGDPEAYNYLPSSVKRFPAAPELAAIMHRVGLCNIRYVLTAGGIIAIHVGEVE